jgi:EF hand
MKTTMAACGLALLLAACASQDEPGRHDHHDGEAAHKPPPSASLFISPAGQPFRAAPGEPYPVVKWFAGANKAGDGKLTRAEFRADAEAFFHILDVNHDGVIDGFEVNDYEQTVVPEIMGAYSGGSGGRGRRGASPAPNGRQGGPNAGANAVLQGAAVYGLLNEPEPVTASDTKLDGHITLAEFLAAADRRFDKLDPKQLGYLTLDTLPKTPAQQMASGKYKQNRDDDKQRRAQQPY